MKSEPLERVQDDYGRDDRALPGYVAALGVFGAAAAGVSAVAARAGRRPSISSPADFVLLALATHKLTRLVAKDAVTSPIRAPFTRFRGPAGNAELTEDVRGDGWHKSVGELVTCPFCLGPWVAGALVGASAFTPTLTRAATTVFSAVAVSDFLHLAYAQAEQREEPPEQRVVQAAG